MVSLNEKLFLLLKATLWVAEYSVIVFICKCNSLCPLGVQLFVTGANLLHFRTFPVNPNLQEGLGLDVNLVSLSVTICHFVAKRAVVRFFLFVCFYC